MSKSLTVTLKGKVGVGFNHLLSKMCDDSAPYETKIVDGEPTRFYGLQVPESYVKDLKPLQRQLAEVFAPKTIELHRISQKLIESWMDDVRNGFSLPKVTLHYESGSTRKLINILSSFNLTKERFEYKLIGWGCGIDDEQPIGYSTNED